MKNTDLVIFDMDGVLVDSEIIAARVEAKLLTKAGFPITPEELAEKFAGLNFPDILQRIEEIASIPVQATLITDAEKKVNDALARRVQAVAGAANAVMSVAGPRCICSNSSVKRINLILTATGLRPFFKDAVYSADDTRNGKGKPEPDVFLLAAERQSAEPSRCVVIEDSVHGVTGARRAGMRVIGFTGGSHSYPGHADALTDAGAITVINRLGDLPATLNALDVWTEPL